MDDVEVEAVMTTTGTTTVCPQCGFDWNLPDDGAADIVVNAPSRYGRAFGGREGPRYGLAGTWSPREYLWHVVDGLRHATEDLWMLAVDPDAGFAPWRQHDIMAARSSSPMSMRLGLWALAVASGEWMRGAQEAPADISSWHPEHGWVYRGWILRWSAHEVIHHEMDILWGLTPG
ncbi:MAG TPA: hypothetical protein VEV65_12340 [Kineosporiaceae bacterium]|nr:hypothetical protein [Kineosporiaceae bacterium]